MNRNDATSRVTAGCVGEYLIGRLHELGVRHVFGVPGDYVLALYRLFEESPIKIVGTTSEAAAGFAADAYARVKGLGAVCVTYGVGGFNLANSVAGAFAERSPVVVISGAPGLGERKPNHFLHHTVQGYATQREVFERLTVANCVLEDPLTAFREIDRVLTACLRYKRPVYIEVPRDRVQMAPLSPPTTQLDRPQSDPHALSEAVEEAVTMLQQSQRPVIIAGIEIHRYGLQDQLLRLVETDEIPLASLLLSKSVVSENHPLYLGVYEAAMGRPEVTHFVEDSDCVLMLGAMISDIDTGVFTHNLDVRRTVLAWDEQVQIGHHHYHGIRLEDFLAALAQARHTSVRRANQVSGETCSNWQSQDGVPVTVRRLFAKINSILDEHMMVIADTGDALFAASELQVHRGTAFLGTSFYASMGFSVPAAVGAQCAAPELRPLVLVGDGAFQMTGMELSTAVRLGLNPVVVVLNNGGYGTERFLLEGKFNDIHAWRYHRLPDVLGGGQGFEVRTEPELEESLTAALANKSSVSLLNVHLDPKDTSPALQRFADRLARRV